MASLQVATQIYKWVPSLFKIIWWQTKVKQISKFLAGNKIQKKRKNRTGQALVENRALVQASPADLSRFCHEPEPMGVIRPGSCARGPAGPRGALVPVRLGAYVPVLDKNRDQWASLLAHNH